jgi:hypothetical protein
MTDFQARRLQRRLDELEVSSGMQIRSNLSTSKQSCPAYCTLLFRHSALDSILLLYELWSSHLIPTDTLTVSTINAHQPDH